MPNPFPGIDPYIEDQYYWGDFHSRFIGACSEALADGLPDHYQSRIDEQVQLMSDEVDEIDERQEKVKQARFGPDVAIVKQRAGREAAVLVAEPVAAVVANAPVMVPAWIIGDRCETYIKIIRRSDRRLVTVIEILSPANKTTSVGNGYFSKRNELLQQEAHLVEVDLLVRGRRMTMRRPMPPGDAYAIVSREERRPDCEVYAWTIREPLPTIQIPLATPDPDIALDLAAVYATTYQRGRYERSIDRKAALVIPLADEDRAWAEKLSRGPLLV